MKTEAAKCAQAIRKDLKAMGIKKARVTSKTYSMGDNVNVEVWDQNPQKMAEIEKALAKYEYGSFDGMQDLYEHNNMRDDIPQTKFLFIKNRKSEDLENRLYNFVRLLWNKELPEEKPQDLFIPIRSDQRAYLNEVMDRYFTGSHEGFWA